MMLKKLSSLICVLIIVASLTVTCFAQPSADSGTNNRVDTLLYASEGAKASSDRQIYILEIEGNENITEKEQIYMTFVVTDLEGKDLEIHLRIKKDTSGQCKIRVTNKAGNALHHKGTNSPYIQQNIFTSRTSFEITVTSDSLIINGTVWIKDVTSISDINVFLSNDNNPEKTTQATDPSSSSNSYSTSTDQVEENNSEENNSSVSGIKTVIIVIVAAVILSFIIKLIIGAYQK